VKYIEASQSAMGIPTIELTRRNLEILLRKLDDPISARTISKDGHAIHAVEEHDGWAVVAVDNDEHYAKEGRLAGEMYMPSTGETV
jgi:hypothetical protein